MIFNSQIVVEILYAVNSRLTHYIHPHAPGRPSFLAYWRNARSRTVRVLEALGPEDLEWAPMPGAFSFGDLFRHLAGLERFMYAENVLGRPSVYPGHGADLAAGLEGVRAYLDRCHAESLAIFGQLSDADLLAPCLNPAGTSMASA